MELLELLEITGNVKNCFDNVQNVGTDWAKN